MNTISIELAEQLFSGGGAGGSGFTADGGIYITLINNTGVITQKGTIVAASQLTNNAARIAPGNYDQPIGVIAEDGILIGQPVKVVVSGKAYVLLKDLTAATRGYWCGVSDIPGRMYQQTDPPSTTEHNREIGHCLESVTAGVNKLALCVLHFN